MAGCSAWRLPGGTTVIAIAGKAEAKQSQSMATAMVRSDDIGSVYCLGAPSR
ncbi:MAG: hypothetical protein Kow0026_18000 [Oricola sp.]